jgi:hypothetical protein
LGFGEYYKERREGKEEMHAFTAGVENRDRFDEADLGKKKEKDTLTSGCECEEKEEEEKQFSWSEAINWFTCKCCLFYFALISQLVSKTYLLWTLILLLDA